MNVSVLPPKSDLVNLSTIVHRPGYADGSVGTLTTKQIIDSINHAVTRNQRMHALQTALPAFSHTTTDLHNYELDLGAANACCLKLGYAMLQYRQQRTYEIAQEVDLLCACLHQLLGGCSSERLAISYREVGQAELIPLLMQIVLQIQGGNVETSMFRAVWRALLILRIIAKLDEAKVFIVNFPGLLSHLAQKFLLNSTTTRIITETVGLIKTLCFRSSNKIKKTLFDAPGLLKGLIDLADLRDDGGVKHMDDRERRNSCDQVTAIVWNFAMSESIAKAMVFDDDLIASLSRWLVHDETTLKTKRNALSALGNLARCCGSSRKLDHFLSLLPSIVRQEDDVDCRRRAMRTIRHLLATGCTWNGDDMLPFLLSVVNQDPDRDTRIQALESMRHVKCSSQVVTGVGSRLSRTVEESMDAKVTLVACSTLQALLTTEQIVNLMTAESFLGNLNRSLKSLEETQQLDNICCDLVIKLLESISALSEAASSKAGMDLIATILGQGGRRNVGDSKTRCLRILEETVASQEQSKLKAMADHELLLSSIVNFALEEEGEAKESAKKLIVALVVEL